ASCCVPGSCVLRSRVRCRPAAGRRWKNPTVRISSASSACVYSCDGGVQVVGAGLAADRVERHVPGPWSEGVGTLPLEGGADQPGSGWSPATEGESAIVPAAAHAEAVSPAIESDQRYRRQRQGVGFEQGAGGDVGLGDAVAVGAQRRAGTPGRKAQAFVLVQY